MGLPIHGQALSAEDAAFLNQAPEISSPEFLKAVLEDERERVAKMIVQDERLVRSRDGSGASALQVAAYQGLDEMLALLLRAESELDVAEAALCGRVETLRGLLEADPSAADAPAGDGFRPLGLAAQFGQLETLELLLEKGADPSLPAQNPTLMTPLHHALAGRERGRALVIGRRLIAAGADLEAFQAGGFTALHRAASLGWDEMVELLLKAGAERGALSDLGRTPAELAQAKGFLELAAILERV